MGETGTVVELKNDGKTAVISFVRTEACAKCKACMAGFSSTQMVLEAKNGLSAQKGDKVTIELPEKGFITATLIMYIFPLAAALAGFLIGGAVSDILGFVVGILLLILAFLIIRANERKLKQLPIFLPYISVITQTAENPSVISEPLK